MPRIPRGQDDPADEAPPQEHPPTQQHVTDPGAAGAAAPAEGATTEMAAPTTSEGATVDAAAVEEHDPSPGFRARTRMRRRLRYLRRLRELAFRDLGGLVFDLHRFGRERHDLVQGKLDALGAIDGELRTLEGALRDHREYTDLREVGIAACPRCGALHDTDANFCPGCGTPLRRAVVKDAAPVSVAPADQQQADATPSS